MIKTNDDALAFFDEETFLKTNIFPVNVENETIRFLVSGKYNKSALERALKEIVPFKKIEFIEVPEDTIKNLKLRYIYSSNSFTVSSKKKLIFPPSKKSVDKTTNVNDFMRFIVYSMIKKRKISEIVKKGKKCFGISFSFEKIHEFLNERYPLITLTIEDETLYLYFEKSAEEIYLELIKPEKFFNGPIPEEFKENGLKIILGGEPFKDQLFLQIILKSIDEKNKLLLVPKRILVLEPTKVFSFSLKLFGKMFNYLSKKNSTIFVVNPSSLYYLFLWANKRNVVSTLPISKKIDFYKRVEVENLSSALKANKVSFFRIEYIKTSKKSGKFSPYRVKIQKEED